MTTPGTTEGRRSRADASTQAPLETTPAPTNPIDQPKKHTVPSPRMEGQESTPRQWDLLFF